MPHGSGSDGLLAPYYSTLNSRRVSVSFLLAAKVDRPESYNQELWNSYNQELAIVILASVQLAEAQHQQQLHFIVLLRRWTKQTDITLQ